MVMSPQHSAIRGISRRSRVVLTDTPDPTEVPSKKRRVTHWLAQLPHSQEYSTDEDVSGILARKKSTPSLRRKQSDQSLTGSALNLLEEDKNAAYRDTRYEIQLEAAGVYINDAMGDLPSEISRAAEELLTYEARLPSHSLFSEDLFDRTCRAVRGQNAARVRRDITPHLFPAPFTYPELSGHKILIESTDDGWNSCIPLTRPRPQPDQAIGFCRSAFSEEQLARLSPYIGGRSSLSYFMGTWDMYFPFFTVEVKASSALDIADRQNAHSAGICARAVVKLYSVVGREQELDGQTLAWSISHDQSMVRIYGYYVKIKDQTHTVHRYDIQKFDFTNQRGRDRWTSYHASVGIIEKWAPEHLERICSVVDQLPVSINASQSTDIFSTIDLGDSDTASFSDQNTPVTSFTAIDEERTLVALAELESETTI